MWLEQGDFAIINMLDKHALVSIGQGLLNAMWNTVMKRARTVVAAAMVSVLPALAEEYHVSPDGNDSADGSSARPWRTIQRAADAAVAGDVVVVHGGVYREWVKPANAGREDAPITYRAADGERPVVTGADEIRGWTRRPDGLWQATLAYDSFGGLNPFRDFIDGDWFDPRGERRFRTKLTQCGKPLVLHVRDALFADAVASDPTRCLVNVAGVSSGGKAIPGSDTAERMNCQDGFETEWGKELGWITCQTECVYDFGALGEDVEIHYSCETYPTTIGLYDADGGDTPFAEAKVRATGSWTQYTTVRVSIPATARATKRLRLRFCETAAAESPTAPGHAVLVPNVSSGTIIAAFEQDPGVAVPELVVRPACFYPVRTHRDYIHVRGISFRDAGPDWAPPTSEQVGAVGTNWSKGWVIEDCEISGSTCAGLTLGKYGDEFDNLGATAANYHGTIRRAVSNGLDRVGSHTVRRCRVTDCGQVGVCGSLGAVFSRIEDCEVSYCFWQKPYYGCEMGGIKIHGAVDFAIDGCRVHHCGYSGIWFDWMAQGARISRTRLWANDLDFFFEVNHGPILVEGCDLGSAKALIANSQNVAFIGSRIAGSFVFGNDSRKTPVFEPHSVVPVSIDEADCGQGAFVFINNILAYDPAYADARYPSRFEDNWSIPAANWRVDDATGSMAATPETTCPQFRPVDAGRLGRASVFVNQEYPEPTPGLDTPQLGTGFALYLSGTWQAGQLSAAHPAETVFGQ